MSDSTKKTLLVAEDDNFLANAYRAKLEKAGYEVILAADGDEVFAELGKKLPDILILDLIMPKMNGFAVLEKMKVEDRFKNIPVLVATNLGQREDIEKITALGVKDYVIKSDLSLEELISKIESVLKRSVA